MARLAWRAKRAMFSSAFLRFLAAMRDTSPTTTVLGFPTTTTASVSYYYYDDAANDARTRAQAVTPLTCTTGTLHTSHMTPGSCWAGMYVALRPYSCRHQAHTHIVSLSMAPSTNLALALPPTRMVLVNGMRAQPLARQDNDCTLPNAAATVALPTRSDR